MRRAKKCNEAKKEVKDLSRRQNMQERGWCRRLVEI